jgi:thiol-disulfide isomerase/thioredoxin
MAAALRPAPPLAACAWINSPPLALEVLRGKVVMLHAFQLHCPGCVELATPQAQRVHEVFAPEDVAVIGLHTVFERHEEAGPAALERYVREQGLTFPIAIDTPDGRGGTPLTMAAYRLDGTPSVVLIDRAGRLRMKRLGHVPDLALGALIGSLIQEPQPARAASGTPEADASNKAPVAGANGEDLAGRGR